MFSALLDTCVLVPSRARDVLLEIASTGAYRPLWSTEILAELDRTLRLLLAKRGASPEETDAYLTRLFRQMETAFPDALVTGWEPLVGTVQLPDPDDRHVVAAAWAGRADVIITDNLADFPPDALPAPLFRQSLDDFLLDSLDLYPAQVITAARAVAHRTGRSGPAMTSSRRRRLPPDTRDARLRRTPAGRTRPARDPARAGRLVHRSQTSPLCKRQPSSTPALRPRRAIPGGRPGPGRQSAGTDSKPRHKPARGISLSARH